MKRMLALSLSVLMGLSMTAEAYAENSTTIDSEKSYDIAVYGSYSEHVSADEIISADIKWDSMKFIYAKSQDGEWIPELHDFDEPNETAGWISNTAKITVVNHSNTALEAGLAFAAAEGTEYTGDFYTERVEGNITYYDYVDKLTLENAETVSLNDPDNAPTKTVTFAVGGDMEATQETDYQTIGKITITLGKSESTGDADVFDGLDLTGIETGGYESLITPYLQTLDPDKNGEIDLTLRLGTDSVSKEQGTAIHTAVRAYYTGEEKINFTIEDVTSIDSEAFNGTGYCYKTMAFPKVTTIGQSAFKYCACTEEFVFLKATIIGNTAFSGCTNLKKLTFASLIETFGSSWIGTGYAFGPCPDAKPENVTLVLNERQATEGSYRANFDTGYVCGDTFKEILKYQE